MSYEINRVDVFVGDIKNQPGALAETLEGVLRSEANLDFAIVRQDAERPGHGVLFVAPLVGERQAKAAEEVGLRKANSMHALRLVGPDRPGLGAGIARTLADAGLNITGLSAAAIGDKSVFYVRFASSDDVVAAAQVLSTKLA